MSGCHCGTFEECPKCTKYRSLDGTRYHPAEYVADLEAKLATAEANVARAVEALEEIAKFDAPAEGGEYTKMWMRLGRKAREALATIKGETK